MLRRLLAAVLVIAVAAALLLALWPQLLGLEREPVIAHAVSLRGMAALVAAALAVLLTLVALLSPAARRLAGTLAVLLLVFALITVAVLATRGAGSPGLGAKAPADITVLSWNTLGDEPGAARIAELALEIEADVVALPETSAATGVEVRDALAAAGRPMQLLERHFDEVSKARSTVLLISTELGEYRLDESAGSTATLPSVIAVPVDGAGPTIVAAHVVAPVPDELAGWKQGLRWLAARCAGEDVILAGDLNATLDHMGGLGEDEGELGGCRDAARATGDAAVGTWPTALPPLLGAPIDHVMTTDAWEAVGFRVVGTEDGAGSDHRPVVARLRPSG